MIKYSIGIHGGAGSLSSITKEMEESYTRSMLNILNVGELMLKEEKAALDVVEACISLMEDDPLYNAGKGSVLRSDGNIDMDAAIMDGKTLNSGGVINVEAVKNPIKLARLVMEKTKHVLLCCEGALALAQEHHLELQDQEYFKIERRVKQWEEAKKEGTVHLDHDGSPQKKYGTVGVVVKDSKGNLAAGTSTGGTVNRLIGRVSDSPIIGAGTYADNNSAAVSTTGHGENFIKTTLAVYIAHQVLHNMLTAQQAADVGMEYLKNRVSGEGGVIVVDTLGNTGLAFSTEGMIRAWINKSGQKQVSIHS